MTFARRNLLVPILVAFAAPATATAAADDRVRSVRFTPDSVVRFVGSPGYQSAIRFGPDERIENVAVGDSASWQVTPNRRGNLLFVKPLVAGARSNLTVVTDKRTYLFDLEAPRAARPIYALSFEYPAWPSAGAVEPPPPPPEPEAPAARTEVVAVAAPVPAMNFRWSSNGARALVPAQIFDDGRSLFLSWPPESPLPAVLTAAPDGTEAPVDYRVEAGFIVIDGLPSKLILRRGDQRTTIQPASERTGRMRSARRDDR